MASLCVKNSLIVLSVNDNFIIYDNNDGHITILQEINVQHDLSESFIVVSSALSENGELFAFCSFKFVYIHKVRYWNLLNKVELKKAATKIAWYDDQYLIAADKAGDVYRVDVETGQCTLLLGHTSMLLDVIISTDKKHIITCDRDEKIRVSKYPNCYNIESFCLGHEEFVTCLNLLANDTTYLVSGSGDGTIRFWQYVDGIQVLKYSVEADKIKVKCDKADDNTSTIINLNSFVLNDTTSLLALCIKNTPAVLVYKITTSNEMFDCNFYDFLPTRKNPICTVFNDDFLYTLIQDSENPICTFQLINKTEMLTECNILHKYIIESTQKYSKLLEKPLDACWNIQFLYKRKYDNVEKYMKKKRARLNELSNEKDIKKLKN